MAKSTFLLFLYTVYVGFSHIQENATFSYFNPLYQIENLNKKYVWQ